MLRAAIPVFVVLAASAVIASAGKASPPVTGVDVFGQPGEAIEVAGRPLGRTLELFRSDALAARLPSPAHHIPRPAAAGRALAPSVAAALA